MYIFFYQNICNEVEKFVISRNIQDVHMYVIQYNSEGCSNYNFVNRV